MSNKEIKVPIQSRSIEKKDKIIRAGFKLFCEKGYHHTTTVEIAKEAGVSTGIVYRYFEDKKDIFIASLGVYTSIFYDALFDELKNVSQPINIIAFLEKIIDIFVKGHNISKSAHEEMLAMSHSDEDVAKYFYEFEEKMTEQICNSIPMLGLDITNAHEKIHIIINIIENYCHEVVYHKHPFMNYAMMKTIVIEAIEKILEIELIAKEKHQEPSLVL